MRPPSRRALTAAAFLLLAPAIVAGRGERPPGDRGFVCGTGPHRELAALAGDAYHLNRARLPGARRSPEPAAPEAPSDSGDVALLEDDGTILSEINFFDLAGRAFRFEPASRTSYRLVASSARFDPAGGTPVALSDDDAASVRLEFLFSFFGTDYTSVWINSDGNLTFSSGDTETAERDLARFTSGQPRIGPFFADLDPTAGGVSVRREPDGIVFIWSNVPAYDRRNANSFTVKLFKTTGAIEFAYAARVDETEAVVGISPGGNEGAIRAVDYSSEPPAEEIAGSIVEIFTDESLLSETALARRFFRAHPDVFDHLIVFLGFGHDLGGAYAYEVNVRNEVRGIGLLTSDHGARFGSKGRLRSFVMMGSLDGPTRYPADPKQLYLGTNSTLGILGQEVGHRWLAFTPFRDGDANSKTILGRQAAHWSFFFDSDGSVLEGNDIEDRGEDRGSQRFVTVGATRTYSLLDRYVMGLAASDEVPAAFVVENPTGTSRSPSSAPTVGVAFGGRRKNVSVEQIVSANGARTPSFLQSPKVIRQAFVLLTRRGVKATPQQIAKVQTIRDAWVEFFREATGERGWIVTDLANRPATTASRFYVPSLRTGAERSTGLALVNWGKSAADVRLEHLDDAGAPVPSAVSSINPRMITLAPGEQVSMLADEIHGLFGRADGWIRAESSSSQVAAHFIEGEGIVDAIDGAAATDAAARQLLFTRAGSGGLLEPDARSLLDLVNPDSASAHIELELVGADGRSEAVVERTLPPAGRLSAETTALFPSAPRGAYVKVSSSVPIAGYQSLRGADALAGLPARVPLTAGSQTKLHAAHFVSGAAGGIRYATDLNLINTSGERRSVELELVSNSGSPVDGIRNPVLIEIPAAGAYRAPGDVLFGLVDPLQAISLLEASLELRSDGAGVLGDVLIGDPETGRFLTASPLQSAAETELLLPHFAQGDAGDGRSYFTGVALFNPGSTDTVVTLDVFSQAGVRTDTATITLRGRERLARTISELAPAAANALRGYIRLRTTGAPIVAMELIGTNTHDFLTAVPARSIEPQ